MSEENLALHSQSLGAGFGRAVAGFDDLCHHLQLREQTGGKTDGAVGVGNGDRGRKTLPIIGRQKRAAVDRRLKEHQQQVVSQIH